MQKVLTAMCHCGCIHGTGQTSGAGAQFCCPNFLAADAAKSGTWRQGTYYDALSVEGAHSCIALATIGNMAPTNAYCGAQTWGPASHLLSSAQTSALSESGTPLGVLSAITQIFFQTIGGSCGSGGAQFTVGANVTTVSTPATGWTWMDGTTSTNLNCGSVGCGFWAPGQPDGSVGSTSSANVVWGGGCGGLPYLDDEP